MPRPRSARPACWDRCTSNWRRPPTSRPRAGSDGSLIPLSSGGAYPTTEQTLAALSLLLNGGGLGQIQDITKALSTAFTGREQDLRSLIGQLDKFITLPQRPESDIIAATDSLNNLVGQFADQKPVVDKALKTIPDALAVLKDERENLADALDQLGKFSALAADSVNQTKDNLVKELKDLGPVLRVARQRRPGADPLAELLRHLPVPQGHAQNWIARRLRQLDRRHRLDAEPNRRIACSPAPASSAI